jgi:hypothetical protein
MGASTQVTTTTEVATGNRLVFEPVAGDAPDIEPVPWLIPGALARRAVWLTAGLGGGAKIAQLINTAVGLAAGRCDVGPFKGVAQKPDGLRVNIISGEDSAAALKRLIAAASCKHCRACAGNWPGRDCRAVASATAGAPRANAAGPFTAATAQRLRRRRSPVQIPISFSRVCATAALPGGQHLTFDTRGLRRRRPSAVAGAHPQRDRAPAREPQNR